MGRPLSRALLLLVLLGRTAGAGRSDTCRLGTYGVPLPDNPTQCPSRLDASGECSLPRAQRAPTSPGKARAADPPAKETSRPWILAGASAQEVTRSPTDPSEAGVLLLENEQCNEWIEGHAKPVETFHCPTQDEYWKIFCCGTCTASYCCSSPKERLDQESCPEGVKGPKDQETEDPTELYSVSLLDFLFIAIALSTIFSMLLCSLKCWIEWKEDGRERRMANAQLDLIRGIRTVSVVDTQAAQGASVTPDLLSLGAAESQNPSEQPTAVANAPCGSGNLIREMMMSPAFAVRGGAGGGGEEENETVL
ncbi:protein shisa-2 homolog [Crotalus tigris]|uniref:protein shisa-2 homolog n=1 Tax=Crotalus tigris TaxID=88082 RepID=UPI00192FB3A9|nr:protein shisa-2 homolog [Crotalus tigris]